MNEIVAADQVATKDGRGAVVVRDPFSPDHFHAANEAAEFVKSVTAHIAWRQIQVDNLGNLDEAPLPAVKTMLRTITEDAKTLLDWEKLLADALLDMSGFKPFVVQSRGAGSRIDPRSLRGRLATMAEPLKTRVDAEKPAAPVHTYFYAVTATDAEHMKLQTAVRKLDAGFACVSPQNDAEWHRAAELFGVKEG